MVHGLEYLDIALAAFPWFHEHDALAVGNEIGIRRGKPDHLPQKVLELLVLQLVGVVGAGSPRHVLVVEQEISLGFHVFHEFLDEVFFEWPAPAGQPELAEAGAEYLQFLEPFRLGRVQLMKISRKKSLIFDFSLWFNHLLTDFTYSIEIYG